MSLPIMEVSIVDLAMRLCFYSWNYSSILPPAVVSDSVSLSQFSLAMRLAILELSLIAVAVWENLGAFKNLSILPDSLSDAAIIKSHCSLAMWNECTFFASLRPHFSSVVLSSFDLVVLLLNKLIFILKGLIPMSFLFDFWCDSVPSRSDWRQIRLSCCRWSHLVCLNIPSSCHFTSRRFFRRLLQATINRRHVLRNGSLSDNLRVCGSGHYLRIYVCVQIWFDANSG